MAASGNLAALVAQSISSLETSAVLIFSCTPLIAAEAVLTAIATITNKDNNALMIWIVAKSTSICKLSYAFLALFGVLKQKALCMPPNIKILEFH
jgi:hypothetical protein